MTELHHHIGAVVDVPAGDIGVGAKEIGYLFGAYRRLTRRFDGTISGKSLDWGGSLVGKGATGYGCVYFAEDMLRERKQSLTGMRCLVSGAGNVAIYTIEKLLQLETVDTRLRELMTGIHRRASQTAAELGEPHNLILGANVTAFRRVAGAMVAQGLC